jgi:multidrug efflux pump
LIVEFAKANQEQGMNLIEATVAAARQRLRPILMTSFAFILGVLPLAIATGAGAGGRIAIGTGVMGGMLTATVLAVLLVPVFFVWIRSIVARGLFPARQIDRPTPTDEPPGPDAKARPVPGE